MQSFNFPMNIHSRLSFCLSSLMGNFESLRVQIRTVIGILSVKACCSSVNYCSVSSSMFVVVVGNHKLLLLTSGSEFFTHMIQKLDIQQLLYLTWTPRLYTKNIHPLSLKVGKRNLQFLTFKPISNTDTHHSTTWIPQSTNIWTQHLIPVHIIHSHIFTQESHLHIREPNHNTRAQDTKHPHRQISMELNTQHFMLIFSPNKAADLYCLCLLGTDFYTFYVKV